MHAESSLLLLQYPPLAKVTMPPSFVYFFALLCRFLSPPVPLPYRHMIYSFLPCSFNLFSIPSQQEKEDEEDEDDHVSTFQTQHPALSCFLLHGVPFIVPVTWRLPFFGSCHTASLHRQNHTPWMILP